MVADIRLESVAASTAFNPKRAMSGRLLGAKDPSPPSKMAMEDKLANPHSANEIIALVFSEIITGAASLKYGAKFRYATNSFTTNFWPINEPAINASLHGTPMIKAKGAKRYPKIISSVSSGKPNHPPTPPNKPLTSAINPTKASNIARINHVDWFIVIVLIALSSR